MEEVALEIIGNIPKAELHVHLEGSIPLDTLNQLAERKGLPPFLESPYRFSDFQEFDALFRRLGPYFDKEQDFYEIALAFAKQLTRQGIVYCEATIMPYVHVARGISFRGLIEAIDAAFTEVEKGHGIRIMLICAIPRTIGSQAGEKTLDWMAQNPNPRVVAIDLAGPELPGTIAPFAPVFERARRMGLKTVAHAGEFLGPQAIWDTIELLQPDRIGHGITAVCDRPLINHLAEKRVPLDISITSNVKLKAVESLKAHPVRRFYDAGIPITINTDDPAFFQTTLSEEFLHLSRELGFRYDEIEGLIQNAFIYGFGNK